MGRQGIETHSGSDVTEVIFAESLLPRLLYYGDVPVESSYHGSALLFRLLESYPRGKLWIVEDRSAQSLPIRRLGGVRYASARLIGSRLRATRFSRWYAGISCIAASWFDGTVGKVSAEMSPEAVITVAHGSMWIAAAKYALRNELPLHLLIHDDWVNVTPATCLPPRYLKRLFRDIYLRASSRFCVSQFMCEEYLRRYGVEGTVLYPSRAVESYPADEVAANGRVVVGLVAAFAGTINSNGYARLIGSLAKQLAKRNGQLLLFGPHTLDSLRNWSLTADNIRSEGLVDSRDLIRILRERVDVLFAPMSFDGGGEMENMKMGFPSKLADYTATGLPVLICGPRYCSAVQWATDNAPVAEVVTSEDPLELGAALDRLTASSYREMLARRALDVGERFFSPSVAQSIVYSALSKRFVS